VNVTVENLASCRKTVRIEVDAQAVDAMFASITKEFQKQASVPGFRPGKAPVAMVLKKHEADIADEVKRKLLSENYRKAMEEQKLDIIGSPDVKDVQFARGQASVRRHRRDRPDFELPDYKASRPSEKTRRSPTRRGKSAHVLREQRLEYKTVERPLANTDIAIVNYTGTSDGRPLTESRPRPKASRAESLLGSRRRLAIHPRIRRQLIGARQATSAP